MLNQPPTPALFERYLRVLGVVARRPSLEALRELTAAHLTHAPFENLSKLLHRRDPAMRLPSLERYLDGVELHGFGGTCYANNSHFAELLSHLGYDVHLRGADMTNPDVHVVSVVTLDDRDYLVDVGYGAPFASPLPLDRGEDTVVELGTERYVLKPRSADGLTHIELYREGRLRHGYRLKPGVRRIGEFTSVIANSFAETAVFMNALMIVRFHPAGSVALYNLRLMHSAGGTTRLQEVENLAALPAVIEQHFGIDARLVERALEGVALTKDVYS